MGREGKIGLGRDVSMGMKRHGDARRTRIFGPMGREEKKCVGKRREVGDEAAW
jgi:hypothetical protein